MSFNVDYTCHRNKHNRDAKIVWLAKKIAHILRHNPYIKQMGIIVEYIDRWEVNLSHD